MRSEMFGTLSPGHLVRVAGTDPRRGPWEHVAYVPDPLPAEPIELSARTYTDVAAARAALAALDTRASLLPNPALLRQPTLRVEAQSTSALEGTYAPLDDVFGADEDEVQGDVALREVLNYVVVAEEAFEFVADGGVIGTAHMSELQRRLVRGTTADTDQAGKVRTIQVAVGASRGGPIHDSRFVPPPPGLELESALSDLFDWANASHDDVDPVIEAAMAHYQFETLHPYNDGNGRLGRLLVVLNLMSAGIIHEPSLSISPWFESRRRDYYDALFGVSAFGGWDAWVGFFARGLASSAEDTDRRLARLVATQRDLKQRARENGLRADRAMGVIDFATARTYFTVRQLQSYLGISYPRTNQLISQLIDAGVLRQRGTSSYGRRFFAPDVLDAVTATS